MRAWRVSRPGPPEVLELVELPRPEPRAGEVLIRVRAFGLNRSELFTRQGHSPSVRFPRVLGIECVGEVVAAPETAFHSGQRVAALMGGMGREFDGGYAEYCCVPARCVVAADNALDWTTFGATPEMFQTAHGSLAAGLGLKAGDTLLVRGGTSSVGLLAIQLARAAGATVLATTRNADKSPALAALGADPVIDDGAVAAAVRARCPAGVDAVLELVGTTTLLDSLAACRPGGTVCMTGILGGAWTLEAFAPMEAIPHTVRLTAYSGGTGDLDVAAYADFLDRLAAGAISLPLDRAFRFDELVAAHRYMEDNRATGKLVVVVD